MKRDLSSKVLAITGASSGIGAATALEAARAGMTVSLGARRVEKLEQVRHQIESAGGRAIALPCDVTNPASVQTFIDQTAHQLGRLDAIYANAGYGLVRKVLDMTEDEHRAIFETNYFGTLHTVRAAMHALRTSDHGLRHIIICTSCVSEIGLPEMGAYCATKAAQDGLAGALRGELMDEGFSVTTVHPVGTKTEFFTTAAEQSGYRPQRRLLPDGPNQTPEQVARAIVRALRHPRPEVWPLPWVRWSLGVVTAFPSIGVWAGRRHQPPRE